jgi:hypothetical protein
MRQRRAFIGQSAKRRSLSGPTGGAAFDVHAPALPNKDEEESILSPRLAADPLSILTVVHWASHAGPCGPRVGPEVFAVSSVYLYVAIRVASERR